MAYGKISFGYCVACVQTSPLLQKKSGEESLLFMLITLLFRIFVLEKNGKQVFVLCSSHIELKNGQGLAISFSEHNILYFSELM